MKAAYYQASFAEFLAASPTALLGQLTQAHGFALEHQQRDAWLEQVGIMKTALAGLPHGHILFEFAVPRWVNGPTWSWSSATS